MLTQRTQGDVGGGTATQEASGAPLHRARWRMRPVTIALAAAVLATVLMTPRWLQLLGGPGPGGPCASLLEVSRLKGPCVLHYRPAIGDDGQEEELRCVYHENRAMRGPCRFNTSQLACTFPSAARLAVAPRPPCTQPWTTQMAIRASADAWRLHRPPAGPPRKAGVPIPPVPRAYPITRGRWGATAKGGLGWRPAVAFRPAAGERCPVEASSAVELVGWARATGIRRIVLSGDSSLRQLYQRALTLARAQPVTVDVVGQRFAHYEVCQEPKEVDPGGMLRDSLWFSVDTFPAARRGESEKIERRLARARANLAARTRPAPAPGLEAVAVAVADGGGGNATSEDGAGKGEGEEQVEAVLPQPPEQGCGSRKDLILDLVMGTLRDQQSANLAAYVKEVLGGELGSPRGGSGNRQLRDSTVFVLAACYWHTAPGDAAVWPDYARLLWNLRDHARHVVVMTCPLVPGMRDEHAEVLTSRNEDLAAMVARDTTGVLRLLDAALMVSNVPLKHTIAEHQYHYSCSFITTNDGKSGPVTYPGHDGVGPEFFNAVRANQDGTCDDPVNYSLWQGLLCLLGAGQNPLDR